MDRAKLLKLQDRHLRDADGLTSLDSAVLAFARMEGLLDGSEVDRRAAKHVLDELVLAMEPEDWNGLKAYAPALGENNLRRLMAYTLRVAADDVKELAADVAQLPEWDVTPMPDRNPAANDEDDDAPPSSPRPRRRDREL